MERYPRRPRVETGRGTLRILPISWENLDLPFEIDHIIAEHHLGHNSVKQYLFGLFCVQPLQRPECCRG